MYHTVWVGDLTYLPNGTSTTDFFTTVCLFRSPYCTASDHQLKMQSYPRLEINFQSINNTTDTEQKTLNTFYKYVVSFK